MKSWKELHPNYPDTGPLESELDEVRKERNLHNETYFLNYVRSHPSVAHFSFPRSGRSWWCCIVANLTGIRPVNIREINDDITYNSEPYFFEHSITTQNKALFNELAGKELRLIYLVRDPRDACLSFIYFSLQKNQQMLLSKEVCSNIVDGVIHGWRTSIEFFTRHNPLIIQYEELCLEPIDEARRVIDFAGLQPICEMNEAVEKEDEDVRYILTPVAGGMRPNRVTSPARFSGLNSGEGRFIAHCNRWKRDSLFIEEFAERIYERLHELMALFGYTKDGYNRNFRRTVS